MARTSQTARMSNNSRYQFARPPKVLRPPKALTPAQQARAAATKARQAAKEEAAMDKPALKAKLLADFELEKAELRRQFDDERAKQQRVLEFKLAEQRQAMMEKLKATPVNAPPPSPSPAAASMLALGCINTPPSPSPSPAAASTQLELDEEMKESDVVVPRGPASSSTVSESPVPSVLLDSGRWGSLDSETVVFPPHWPERQAHHCVLEMVAKDSPDWVRIERQIQANGLPQASILAVQRVFNRPLWIRYYHARAKLMRKYGNESLATPESFGNEKLMFHGTRNNSPHLIYASADGFDTRMSGHGMLGCGSYFSHSSSYSGQSYAHALVPGNSYQKQKPGQRPPINVKPLTKYSAPLPPLYETVVDPKTGRTILKALSIPAAASQMFLARVALGCEYDVRKHGNGGYYSGRPPLRPFECKGCRKTVDLEQLNLDTLKASLTGSDDLLDESEAAEQTQEVQDESESAETAVAAGRPSRTLKRKRTSTWQPKKRRARSIQNKSVASAPAAAAATDAAASTSPSQQDEIVSIAAGEPAAAASSAALRAAALPASCDERLVSCPHCATSLGTRVDLFSFPYRYDSVTSDHMSVVYQSDQAYPEFLITFQPTKQ